MNDTELLKTRIRKLGAGREVSKPLSVLYVMSRDVRIRDNHALLAAQNHAKKLGVPLVVLYVLLDKRVGFRAKEHVQFLIDSLDELRADLDHLNIPFELAVGDFASTVKAKVERYNPAAVYFDFNPLSGARKSKDRVASSVVCPVFIVDTHNVVPVWVASDKQEVGARTLRPKITYHLTYYVREPEALQNQATAPNSFSIGGVSQKNASAVLRNYVSNGTDITRFKPGEKAANRALEVFIKERLRCYAEHRNDPTKDNLTELSPYLHFGNLSSLRVALKVYEAVKNDPSLEQDAKVLIEEMVVRKELSDNYCYHNQNYLNLAGAPEWAQKTLAKHADDPREFMYTKEQFERAKTHDPAWNAAQTELTKSGKIHGYMRMYWAKKVLEWSASPQEAVNILVYLNDFYSLDGGDPNGYVGILWSVAGLHDRPWGERSVYGTVRSMVYNGLKRKFDIESYITKWVS